LYATVPQAEAIALLRAADQLMEIATEFEAICFFVECLGLIVSLGNETAHSKPGLIWECQEQLNKQGELAQVTLEWIPAHKGLEGNEKVDELAKKAAKTAFTGPQPSIPISMSSIKTATKAWTIKEHAKQWRKSSTSSATKKILPDLDFSKVKRIWGLKRSVLRAVLFSHMRLNFTLDSCPQRVSRKRKSGCSGKGGSFTALPWTGTNFTYRYADSTLCR